MLRLNEKKQYIGGFIDFYSGIRSEINMRLTDQSMPSIFRYEEYI